MSNIANILTGVFAGFIFIAFSLWIGNREYEEWKEARRKRQRNMSPKEKRLDDARDDLFNNELEMRFSPPPHPDPFMEGHFSHMQRSARLEHKRLVERVREAEEDVFGYAMTPKDDSPYYL